MPHGLVAGYKQSGPDANARCATDWHSLEASDLRRPQRRSPQVRLGRRARGVRRKLGLMCVGSFLAMLLVLLGGLGLGVIRIHTVVSASMEPTLHCANGPGCRHLTFDRVIASSLAYLFDRPRRGDIVLIALPQSKRACNVSLAVKRIVALPGDTVAQVRGRVRVNGQTLYEPYRAGRSRLNTDFGPIVSDGFFVMGDNRERSCDSRHFGAVARDEVVAKVLFSF